MDTRLGNARQLGHADDLVGEDGFPVRWNGTAVLFRVDPPLSGFEIIAVSTTQVPRVPFRGPTETVTESMIFGVTEGRVGPPLNQGTPEGPTAALIEAGYQVST